MGSLTFDHQKNSFRPIASKSGVSNAILRTMKSYEQNTALIKKIKPAEFTVKVANTLEERELVFCLSYRVYLEKGYLNPNNNRWLIHPYDANSETVILMVLDANKHLAGSVTIVFDGVNKLPSDKIFNYELNQLRTSGGKIAEISRLVIDPIYRNSKEILVILFNYLAIYTYHAKNYNSLVIEVNPRHANYYKTLMYFKEISGVKPCPLVQNAPAILLNLPMQLFKSEVKRCHSTSNLEKKDRSLITYFLKPEQEFLVSHYLEKQVQPISEEEKKYFGMVELAVHDSVCL